MPGLGRPYDVRRETGKEILITGNQGIGYPYPELPYKGLTRQMGPRPLANAGAWNSLGQKATNKDGPRPQMLWRQYAKNYAFFVMSGVSRDNVGTPLGNCEVLVFEAGNNVLMATTQSDGSGNWSATLPNNAGPFWVSYYLAGSPNRGGRTDKTLLVAG